MHLPIHITCYHFFLIFQRLECQENLTKSAVCPVYCSTLQSLNWQKVEVVSGLPGALKPIYLIDVWTWSVGLTSGENCELDFSFNADCVALSPLFLIPPEESLGTQIL